MILVLSSFHSLSQMMMPCQIRPINLKMKRIVKYTKALKMNHNGLHLPFLSRNWKGRLRIQLNPLVVISSTGTLKCSSFSEIILLLKSSDSLIHDLCHAYDSCSDKTATRQHKFVLALRKWYASLRPEMEFRCFAFNQFFVGISQREVTGFYPSLLERKVDLKLMIWEFYADKLRDNFELESYIFDVYVTTDGRVKLLVFNPWGGSTLPLRFTWEELEENFKEEEKVLEFRIIESQCGVRPGMKTAVPYDYLDTSQGSYWDQFLKKANKELRQQSTEAGA